MYSPGCTAGSATESPVKPTVPLLRPLPMIWDGPIAAFNFTEGSRPKCGDTDRGY